ncbi:MAG TPA: type IX secretion system membrane protein PorP/SprF [Chitinophagales bacterium]|nr:type IX secretion system membrane protein PorP/SprF [Chitinophagales bacterium]
MKPVEFKSGAVLLLLFFALKTVAQQDPQFSQHFLNQAAFNPAYTGLDNALSATAQFRSQWVGIDGHPVTQNISLHSPIPLLHGGLGINILNEQAGVLRNTTVSLNYSYIVKSGAGDFSIGLSGGAVQVNVDGSKLRAPEGVYQNGINHNDFLLPIVPVSGFSADFSAGIFFSGKNLSAGLSANHVIPQSVKLNTEGSSLEFNYEQQYYLQLGYLAKFSKSFSMRPSAIVKSDGTRLQGEGDLIFIYKDFLWMGGGYRGFNDQTMDAIVGLLGISISENFRLGYSYDYTVSALNSVSSGSHEVVLNYRVNLMKPVKPGKVVYTPRF